MVEVRYGEPVGPNASSWDPELGMRIRSHLDVTNAHYLDQDEINVDKVIQKMENVFETIDRRISTNIKRTWWENSLIMLGINEKNYSWMEKIGTSIWLPDSGKIWRKLCILKSIFKRVQKGRKKETMWRIDLFWVVVGGDPIKTCL